MAHNTQKTIHELALAAMFLAVGLILPFFTGQIPQVGNMLLPMHMPVLVCGLICGGRWGLAVGFLTPLLRSALFGMPVLFPKALSMAFELAAYGALAGGLYSRSRWKCLRALYRALLGAMLGGRVVWGCVMTVLMGLSGGVFTWRLFLTEAFFCAIPGILLQLLLIPALMLALRRTGMVHFHRKSQISDEKAIK